MHTYSLLREFADSWMLLVLFGVFALMLVWVFRPGSRRVHQDSAAIPFRNTDRPAPAVQTDKPAPSRENQQ